VAEILIRPYYKKKITFLFSLEKEYLKQAEIIRRDVCDIARQVQVFTSSLKRQIYEPIN
jgi:hypothetical protein